MNLETARAGAQMEERKCAGPGPFGKGCPKKFRVMKTSPVVVCSEECGPQQTGKERSRRSLQRLVGPILTSNQPAKESTKVRRMQEKIEKAARRAQFDKAVAAAGYQGAGDHLSTALSTKLRSYIESGAAAADQAKVEAERGKEPPEFNQPSKIQPRSENSTTQRIDSQPASISFEELANRTEADEIAEMERRWKRYVDEAKPFVINLCSFRIEVAKIAVKACQINHGGGAHWKNFDGVFTIKRFAEEIGVNPKTLSEWVATFRNVISRLPDGVYVENNFEAARRVKNDTTAETTPEEVAARYRRELASSTDRERLVQGVKRFRTLHFLLHHKVQDLGALLLEAPDHVDRLERLCEETLAKIREARRANKA